MFSTDEQPKRFCEVHGKKMAYVDVGDGGRCFPPRKPNVFLHLEKREPHVAPYARCIAPDLIGMVTLKSSKKAMPIDTALWSTDVFLMLSWKASMLPTMWFWWHRIGSGAWDDWARRHARDVRALLTWRRCAPERGAKWIRLSAATFERLRSSEVRKWYCGTSLYRKATSRRTIRELSEVEMNVYRRLTSGRGKIDCRH